MTERNSKNKFSEQKQENTQQREAREKPTEWLIEGLIPKGASIFMEICD